MVRIVISLFLLFSTTNLVCDERTDTYSLAVTEGEPSAMIAGCVSALTGDLYFYSVDHVIPGAEPFPIHRTYYSRRADFPAKGWGWKDHTEASRETLQFYYKVPEKSGTPLIYSKVIETEKKEKKKKKHDDNKQKKIRVELSEDCCIGAFTNCGQGELSGRHNLKNNFIEADPDGSSFTVFGADGTQRHYIRKLVDKQKGQIAKDHIFYCLQWETLSNGNRIDYNPDDRGSFTRIKYTNPKGDKIYAFADIHLFGNLRKDNDFDLICSDGHKVGHRLERKGKKEPYQFFFNEILSPDFREEKMRYWQRDKHEPHFLSRRELPDGRILDITYYDVKPFDPKYGCVHELKAPVGPGSELITIHKFNYFPGEYGKTEGYTEVFDAEDNKSVYRYSPELRLDKIERYSKRSSQQLLYNSERLSWGERGSSEVGNLLAKTFLDDQGNALFSRRFFYDDKGNVKEEKFYGCLTGQSSPPLLIDAKGLPQENGVEFFSKRYEYSQDGKNLLTREADPSGKVTLYTYLAGTDLVTSKLICDKEQIRIRQFFEYNEDNILVREITDDGSTAKKEDLSGVTQRTIKVITPKKENPFINMPEVIEERVFDLKTNQEILLKKIVLTYGSQGKVERQDIYDATGKLRYSLKTKYDERGRPCEETNAIGQVAFSKYDANNNKISYKDFSGKKTVTMHYDCSNRLTSIEETANNGEKHTLSHTYDFKHNKTSTTDTFGNKTLFEYDAFGHCTRTKLPEVIAASGKPFSPISSAQYDSAGRKFSTTDPRGETCITRYNALSKPIEITYPDRSQEKFIYNLDGTLQYALDQTGTKTHYTYDFLGRETSKTIFAPTGEKLSEESFIYNSFHLLQKVNAEGDITSYFYDCAGRKSAEESLSDFGVQRIEYTYDELGRVHKVIKLCGDATLIGITERDLLDRPVEERQEDASGNILSKVTYSYDAMGNKERVTRFIAGKEVNEHFFFDAFGRPIRQQDALGYITNIAYNENFKNARGERVLQKTHTDPMGLLTIETYDILGRVASIEKKSPLGETLSKEELFYDEGGKLARQISTILSAQENPRIVETLWDYGLMGRLSFLTEANGTPKQKTTRYSYTLKNQIKEIIKPDGVVLTHDYDPLGNLILLHSSDSSCSYAYSYNRLHQLLTSHDLITGAITTRDYGKNGFLLKETLATGFALQNQYDASGRRTLLTLPDRSTIAYSYDPLFLREVSRYTPNGTLAYTHRYTDFDLSGHLLEEQCIDGITIRSHSVDTLGRTYALHSPFGEQTINSYDPRGNITQITWNTPSRKEEINYSYDHLSQLTAETGTFAHTYAYDSHYNRLLKDNDAYKVNDLNELLETTHSKFTYDPNGNPISNHTPDGDITYTYDALDRLTSVTLPEHYKLTFTYDSSHRRLTKTTHAWQNNSWQPTAHLRFLYDGQNEIGAIDNTNTITELRVLGSTPQAEIGAAIALELHGQTYIPFHDLSGNLSALISLATHTLTQSYHYSAFGEEAPTTTPPLSPWRFSSKRTDPETHLVYYGRRYYSPSLGRWLTPDPAGLSAGPNLYAFVLNDPLLRLDLYGLEDTLNQSNFFTNLYQGTCKFFYNLFHHLVPSFIFPHLHHGGKALMNIACQEKIKDPTSPSRVGKIEGKPFNNIVTFGGNGMLNTFEDMEKTARDMSKRLGGAEGLFLYNSSHGGVGDGLEAGVEWAGIMTHPIKLATETLRAIIKEGKIACPWGNSEFGIIIDRACRNLTPEERLMVAPFTIGSPDLFSLEGFYGGQHYVSNRDPVCWLSPIKYLKARFFGDKDVTFLPASKGKIFDHPRDNDCYQYAQDLIADSFLDIERENQSK